MTFPIHPDRVDDVTWRDTFGAARSDGRGHMGVDMIGEKMIPLVAVRSGTVTWGRFNNGRGSILRFRDDEGWEYQYIHLNNDSPGTDDGDATCAETFTPRLCAAIVNDRFESDTRVTEGEVIAYLGDGGNAEGSRAHVHFEVYKPSDSGVVAINPTPSVDAAKLGLAEGPSGAREIPARIAPGEAGFVDHLWHQIHGRTPGPDERAAFDRDVANGGVWVALAAQVDSGSTAATIDRLYLAFFQRYPDAEGIQYWVQEMGSGHRIEDIAEWFALSDEFRIRYEGVPFAGFLDRLYADVLDRVPDENGKAYWLDELEQASVTRGTIVSYFTESTELRSLTGHRNELVALSLIKDGTVPTDADVNAWAQLRSSSQAHDAVSNWFVG